jgi:hypothetical protein
MPAFQDGQLLAESKIVQHQASAGVKDAKEGSKPEPKDLEHGVRVIADRIFTRIPMLFISKPDRIVAAQCLQKANILHGEVLMPSLQERSLLAHCRPFAPA